MPVFVLLAACNQSPEPQQTKDTVNIDSAVLKYASPVPFSYRDTVVIGNILYGIDDIGKAEFDAVPADQWSFGEENMKLFQDKVFRAKDTLTVKLGNGGRFMLVNHKRLSEDNAEGEMAHYFLGYLPGLESYLIFSGGDEMFSYILLQEKTGDTLHMIGEPQFSPDKKQFICSNADLDAGFNPNGFQLFRNEKEGVRRVHEFNPGNWGPIMIKWKDRDNLVGHFLELARDGGPRERYVKLSPL